MRLLSILILYVAMGVTLTLADLPKYQHTHANVTATCGSCPDFNQRWFYNLADRKYNSLTENRLLEYAEENKLIGQTIEPSMKPHRKTGRIILAITAIIAATFVVLAYICFRCYRWRDMS